MFGNVKTEVLVVGAGPVGLLAALQLADEGIDVEIIDEQWRPAGHSYALALHASSLRLFERVGLVDELLARGLKLSTMTLFEDREPMGALNLGLPDTPYPFVLAIPQSELERLLVARLERKGVRVRWNHRLASLASSEDGIVARVDRLEKESSGYAIAQTHWVIDSTKEFRAAFVVGADGHRSMVRRALGAPFDEMGPSQVFAAFECAAGGSHPEQPSLVLQRSNVNVMWPLEKGRARWSIERGASVADADDRYKSRLTTQIGERYFAYLDEDVLRALLLDRAPWFGPLRDLGWSIEICFERRLASLAGRERIWLAGDALHTTAPAGMQSMNAGLREASSLASCVTRSRRGGDGRSLFEEYGRATLKEWRFLLGAAGGLKARPSTAPFVARNASRLLACLPGTGDELDALAEQLELEVER